MMGMTKYFAVSWYFIRRDHKIYLSLIHISLSPEKIRRIVHHPELEQLCHIGQFFRYASQEKAFSTSELRDRTFTRWLVSHPAVFRKLAPAGYAQQSSLAILYRLWNSADRDLCGVDLNIALGACLIADVFTAEECIACLLYTSINFTMG